MRVPGSGGGSACESWRPLLLARAAGGLEDEAERDLLAHLAACDACRDEAALVDPSVLFLELRSAALPDDFWAGFDRALAGRLRARPARFDWRSLFRYPRLAYVTTPLAMLLVLGVTVFVARPGGPGWRPGEGIRSPFQAPAGAAGGAPAGAAAALPPVLEEVASPGARVYRFSVGGAGDETPIYLVVDESIDI